ncbi:MAG: hypothetical protein Q8941_15945 [Bacteroidota bacterium]|nr:hypothetical protein [Bacteroidota bacterium]
MNKKYYFFYLELALRKSNDSNIYGYENVSHISTKKLIEIFNINLDKDPYLSEGYFLTKTKYKKYKKFISANIGQLNLDIFEYSLRLYATDDVKEIRKLYKEDLME